MTTSPPVLAFVDVETTGLDARIHQPYEVCVWRSDRTHPTTIRLPHTLEHADAQGLAVGRYIARGFGPFDSPDGTELRLLVADLAGTTLVGSNPTFDAAMLTRFIGCPVWSHRLIDVAQAAMWVLDTDQPVGLARLVEQLQASGHDIPDPDHTAEGDVRATRAAYEALRRIHRHRRAA